MPSVRRSVVSRLHDPEGDRRLNFGRRTRREEPEEEPAEHKCDYSRLAQHTVKDRGDRILGFEKYCAICGLVEEALPIGSIVK